VLLDLMMPRMNGQEALQEIRKRWPSLPVVLSSGYTERDAVQRFRDDGPAAFIQKPYMAQQLVTAIRHALNKPNQDESFDG
jgi:CheY-like chemotaxis protein